MSEHSRKEDSIELSYNIELYFDKNLDDPQIKSLTRKIIIPIVRVKNSQHLDKWAINNTVFITLGIAFWSLVVSVFGARVEIETTTNKLNLSNNDITILIVFIGLILGIRSEEHTSELQSH